MECVDKKPEERFLKLTNVCRKNDVRIVFIIKNHFENNFLQVKFNFVFQTPFYIGKLFSF